MVTGMIFLASMKGLSESGLLGIHFADTKAIARSPGPLFRSMGLMCSVTNPSRPEYSAISLYFNIAGTAGELALASVSTFSRSLYLLLLNHLFYITYAV